MWVLFEPYVFVYCANILMNLNRIHFGSLVSIDIAQDLMQTMAVDCVDYGYAPVAVAVYLAMVDLLLKHLIEVPSK